MYSRGVGKERLLEVTNRSWRFPGLAQLRISRVTSYRLLVLTNTFAQRLICVRVICYSLFLEKNGRGYVFFYRQRDGVLRSLTFAPLNDLYVSFKR